MKARSAAIVAAVAVLVSSLGLGTLAAPAPALAAPSLTLTSDTTYTVDPANHRVRVSSVLTARNHLVDTVTKQYFFQAAYISVLPGTSGFKLTAPGLNPGVRVVARRTTYNLLKLFFGKDLGAGKALALTLTFDIKDPGGEPDRPVRISPSIVSFPAWAYATNATPGGTVTVKFPTGYHVTVGRGPLAGPTTDATTGVQTWTSGRLETPLAFVADLSADRPGDYEQTPLAVAVGDATATLDLQSWPDDPPWRDRVRDLLVRGLPALGTDIGVPWPVQGELTVQEALVRTTGGYAGLFDPSAGQILVSYRASSTVVLHEAAHAWFNGRLVGDRWIAEAFASYYAATAAEAMGVKVENPVLTDKLKASAFPLNAWGPIGTLSDTAEAYGYAASFELAKAVAERAGPEAMRAVWARAAGGIGAYQPATGGEPVEQPPDWRTLLDLLEDLTGKPFDDLWRTWIARPTDLALLDARAKARAAYSKAVTDAGAWQLPRSIRDELRAWRFDDAQREIAAAEAVLAQRADLDAAAKALGVTPPATLRSTFEGTTGLTAAASEASAELVTLEAIRQAAATDPSLDPAAADVLVSVGLVGFQPASELAGAKAAFETGNLQAAIKASSIAADHWTTAADRGRGRVLSLGLVALAIILVLRMRMLHSWRRRSGSTSN